MNTRDYNRATWYFRRMEFSYPGDNDWGKFADAMDEVISTCVHVVRCKDCKWRNTKACFCVSPKDVLSDWFCSEAERKTGDEGS